MDVAPLRTSSLLQEATPSTAPTASEEVVLVSRAPFLGAAMPTAAGARTGGRPLELSSGSTARARREVLAEAAAGLPAVDLKGGTVIAAAAVRPSSTGARRSG